MGSILYVNFMEKNLVQQVDEIINISIVVFQ